MQPHTSTDDAEVKRIAAILIASGRTERAAIEELLDDGGLELDAGEVEAEIAAQHEEAFAASAFPGDASAIYGAAFHRRDRRGEWPDPKRPLCTEDVDDHLAGRETIAITWPSRVNCAEIDIDAKDPAGLITLRSRVDRVISIFGAERCIVWHSSSGPKGGRRVRIVFDELHDAVAVRRAVVARLEAAGLAMKGGQIELWPNGGCALRAPLGRDSALVLADGTLDRSRSVAAWKREVDRVRAPIADLLPKFDEYAFAIEGTLIGRICEVVTARRLTSQKAIVRAVGGNTTAVRGAVAALIKAGGIKSEGQRAPFTVDLRRAALFASGAPCSANNLIRRNTRGDQIRSDHDLKDPDLEGTPTGRILPYQVDRGTRGPTRRGKGSPLAELRLLEAGGCEAGARNETAHRLAQLYVADGLTAEQAAAARLATWLDRDDHRSADLTGDRRAKVKAQMLADLPGAMQRWRDIGFGPARRSRGAVDRGHAYPLIPIDFGSGWQAKMRAELTDRDRARLTDAIDAAALELSATWRGRLEVLLSAMKRAAARGDAGVAVPRVATRGIAGGRMAVDDAGRKVASSTWLVEIAKRVGILGEQLCGAKREEQIARAYAVGALALEEEIAPPRVAAIEIAPTTRSDRFDDVIGHVELLFAGAAINVADPHRFPKIERSSSWTLSY